MALIGRKLGAALRTGVIHLPLVQAREIGSNDIINAAGIGGILSKDSTPVLERVNAATDKALRINWAASNVDEIQWAFHLPLDVDKGSPLYVKARAKMGGSTDTPVLAVGFFKGVGDSNAGGNTGALSATEATVERKIAAADHGGEGAATVTLTPGTHGNDAIHLYDVWIEYTRKLDTV